MTRPDFEVLMAQGMALVPQIKAAGIEFRSAKAGVAEMAQPWREDLVGYRETGVLAGGAVYVLMDSVSGAAVLSALDQPRRVATLDLRIDYLRPAEPQKTLIGRATCFKVTRHVAFVRGLAFHDDPDDPIAHTIGTFSIRRESAGAKNG